MVIDVHAHIYPDNIAEKAAMNIGYFYDKHMTNPNGSVKRLLEIGDRAGVDKFVVHSAATTPHQVKSINNFIKASVLAHPDRFVGLCTIHPGMEDPIAELERAESLGLKGIKLHPDFQKFATHIRLLPSHRLSHTLPYRRLPLSLLQSLPHTQAFGELPPPQAHMRPLRRMDRMGGGGKIHPWHKRNGGLLLLLLYHDRRTDNGVHEYVR